jgi:TRAP-type C4-dicarboxylate transport system permease large subunit
MAETLQVSYASIAVAAAIPGVLYFVAVGVMVHFEAARRGLPVLPPSALPRLGAVLRRDLYLLGGPAVLVYFLVDGRSPLFAGFWGLVTAFVLSWARPDTRIGLARSLAILNGSAQAAMPVALACATVGIVVGVVSTTGLGLKLATGIVGLAGGSLLLTLVLTMVAALVLGTGLPTSATYIITSIMAAPALVELGLPKLVAHMFVFYFGILADLTPPTAISTYATSSIAGADVWRTQWLGMMLALSGFIIPFSFAYDPALLLINASVPHIVLRTLAATLGIVMLGAGLIGYFRAPTRRWERALLLGGALLLIFPGVWSDAAGLLCFARWQSHSAPRAGRRHGGPDGTGDPGLRGRLRARLPGRGRARDRPGDDRLRRHGARARVRAAAALAHPPVREGGGRRHADHRQRGGQPESARVGARSARGAPGPGIRPPHQGHDQAQGRHAPPFHERVLTGADLDLGRLPIPTYFPGDAGRYLTAGMLVARDPETGVETEGYHRFQLKGRDRMGVSLHSRRRMFEYQRRAEARGQALPCAVALGLHPLVSMGSLAYPPAEVGKFEVVGGLFGEPLEV